MRHFRPFSDFDKCRPEAAGDGISGSFVRQVVFKKGANYGHPRLNRILEISPEAVGTDIFDSSGFRYNLRPEGDSDVLSDVAIDNVGMDAHVKRVDSR